MNKRDFLTMLLASAFFPTRTSAKSAVNNRDAQAFVLSLSYSEHPNLALGNTANDGRLMSTIFRKLGFGSVEHLSDTDGEKFAAAFDRFADRIAPSTKAFVYLAGHGIQIAGSNYL